MSFSIRLNLTYVWEQGMRQRERSSLCFIPLSLLSIFSSVQYFTFVVLKLASWSNPFWTCTLCLSDCFLCQTYNMFWLSGPLPNQFSVARFFIFNILVKGHLAAQKWDLLKSMDPRITFLVVVLSWRRPCLWIYNSKAGHLVACGGKSGLWMIFFTALRLMKSTSDELNVHCGLQLT